MKLKPTCLRKAFVIDTFPSVCGCGAEIHLSRRGPVALIPNGHHCPARNTQDMVLRTLYAEESAGMDVTLRRVADMLALWSVGGRIRPAGAVAP